MLTYNRTLNLKKGTIIMGNNTMTEEQYKQYVGMHAALTDGLHKTFLKKNADYGSSFHDTYADLGIISAVTRISDKFNRTKTLAKNIDKEPNVKTESITDTLLDMANYCIMTVMEIELAQAKKE